jgi:hypothetical protein
MPVVGPWEKKRVFITARTYPTPAKKGVEVSCTGGITDDGKWIRLFPIPYRFLDDDQRFSKYQWIEVEAAKASDSRPESYEVSIDSIRKVGKVGPEKYWQARKDIIYPLKSHCLCCLQAQRNELGYPTLGFYKPKLIRRFLIRKDTPTWSESDLAKLSQPSMFDKTPYKLLEKIPYKLIYQVFCDHETCKGHHLSCTDWEIGQAYRRWRRDYGAQWEQKFRQKFEDEMINRFDTHLFVGTIHQHPASWIIVGLFWPPKVPLRTDSSEPQIQLSLFQ